MSFNTVVNEDQRLVILRVLAEDADYAHNEYVLAKALALYGHRISADKLRTELAWLAENNLIALDTAGSVQIAKLTRRGLDVAQGTTVAPGVAQPMPDM